MRIILLFWECLQNLLGRFLVWYYDAKLFGAWIDADIYLSNKFEGGISLGRYIILREYLVDDVKHEYGHCQQSKLLGPLYLFIIGIPSLWHATFYRCDSTKSYFSFWTEKWADNLGGVFRYYNPN